MRLRLDLAYDGTGFHGWARQPRLRTVQGELERALDTVLRTTGSTVTVAGRTDTGVHARGQVCHVDVDDALLAAAATRREQGVEALRRRLDGVLDPDVRVHRVQLAPEGFDARFSATWRRYSYSVADDPAAVDPLARTHVLTWPRPLDLGALEEASAPLVGMNDFAAFCKRREGATTVRHLLELGWVRDAAGVLVATVRADAFCHSMVRSLVGCLLAVGEGRRPASWAGEVLRAGVRDPAVAVVAPHGLVLEEVAYPEDAALAARAEATRAKRATLDASTS